MALTRKQSRAVDAIAIQRYGFSGLVLMENAGRGVVDVLLGSDPTLPDQAGCPVTILCGKGNNAGDGFVIARHLEIRGIQSQVILLAPPEQLQGDALTNYQILQHTDVKRVNLAGAKDFTRELAATATGATWLLDAMLGTGAQGEPREPCASAIRWMNTQPARRLAVDVPSGLDCDTGEPAEPTVRADCTCTFVAAKQGFGKDSAREYLGKLQIVSIGIPPSLVGQFPGQS